MDVSKLNIDVNLHEINASRIFYKISILAEFKRCANNYFEMILKVISLEGFLKYETLFSLVTKTP